jgi:aryl-phospho-beta-D-glucosidase BglC (GH1 family)
MQITTKIFFIFIFLFIFFSANSFCQGFLKADGKKIINDRGENILLRGMGLGGWMLQEGYMLRITNEGQQHKIRKRLEDLSSPKQTEEFYDTWLTNNTRKVDIDSMKSWGFNSVRLPIHYNLYTLPVEKEPVKGGNTWLDKGFQITDSLLSWCKTNKMYLILDLHAAPGGQGNDVNISDGDTTQPTLWASEENKQKTIALWKKLAERYANEPWIGAYDLLNEPNFGFEDPVNDKNGIKEKKNEPLVHLLKEITSVIRQVDKKHIIIIEGNGWGNNYNGMLPPWDNNMVLSFHKYWNFNTDKEISSMLNARGKVQCSGMAW